MGLLGFEGITRASAGSRTATGAGLPGLGGRRRCSTCASGLAAWDRLSGRAWSGGPGRGSFKGPFCAHGQQCVWALSVFSKLWALGAGVSGRPSSWGPPSRHAGKGRVIVVLGARHACSRPAGVVRGAQGWGLLTGVVAARGPSVMCEPGRALISCSVLRLPWLSAGSLLSPCARWPTLPCWLRS